MGINFFFTFPTSEGSDLLSSHVMQTPTFISKLSDGNVIFRLDVGKNYVHTGALESYHNLRLKYAPKRIHFSYNGLYLRSVIAIMDHNWNVNKEKVGEKYMFSKSSGAWVVKNKFQRSNEEWKFNLIQIIKTKLNTIESSKHGDFRSAIKPKIWPLRAEIKTKTQW
jgi:hypothetical protein